jgi:hypothetical protein
LYLPKSWSYTWGQRYSWCNSWFPEYMEVTELYATGCFVRVNPTENTLMTNWTGGWVSLRADMDASEEKEISCPYREPNPSPCSL